MTDAEILKKLDTHPEAAQAFIAYEQMLALRSIAGSLVKLTAPWIEAARADIDAPVSESSIGMSAHQSGDLYRHPDPIGGVTGVTRQVADHQGVSAADVSRDLGTPTPK